MRVLVGFQGRGVSIPTCGHPWGKRPAKGMCALCYQRHRVRGIPVERIVCPECSPACGLCGGSLPVKYVGHVGQHRQWCTRKCRDNHPDNVAKRSEYYRRWDVAWKRRISARSEQRKAYDRRSHLARKFGADFTDEVLSALLAYQHGRCAGCGTDQPGGARNKWHTHHRGRYVIALLCYDCNHRIEPVLWQEWRAGRVVVVDGNWADIITDDATRWPVSRALGYVWDRVPEANWNGDADFVAGGGSDSRPGSPTPHRPASREKNFA